MQIQNQGPVQTTSISRDVSDSKCVEMVLIVSVSDSWLFSVLVAYEFSKGLCSNVRKSVEDASKQIHGETNQGLIYALLIK